MPDEYQTETETNRSITIHVPQTAADLRPPRPADLVTEASNFIRSHWDEVRPFYESLSGEAPSMHGSAVLDEAACVFKIKELASLNGFGSLAQVPTNKLRRALRYGYRRTTGVPIHALESQYRRLRLSHRSRRRA